MRSASARGRDPRLPKPATRRLMRSFARQLIRQDFPRSALVLLLVSLQVFPASAWVFPEHRDIAALALQGSTQTGMLSCRRSGRRPAPGTKQRLCAQTADPAQGPGPACIDFAAWAAISGDHSCSAQEMLDTALNCSLGFRRRASRRSAEGATRRRFTPKRPDQCSAQLRSCAGAY